MGQKSLEIVFPSSKEQLPFFERVFYGDIWAHLFRVLMGLVIVFVIAFLGAVGIVGSESASEKKRTLKLLNELSTSKRVLSFIKEDIINNGVEDIEFAYEQMEKGIDELNKQYSEAKAYLEKEENLLNSDFEAYRRKYAGCSSLFSKGYLEIDPEGKISIPNAVKESVDIVYSLMNKYHLHQFSIKRNLPQE